MLGRTGIELGVLGLGLVKIGRNTGLKHPSPHDLPTDDEAMALLDTAAELGITLLDTAPAYGTSEQRLGGLLAARKDRERWVISTKAGEEYDGASRFDFSPGAIIASCERSLRRLRTERLDVLLLHSDGEGEKRFDRDGAFDALDELKRRGLVSAVGVSVKTGEGVRAALPRCDALMIEYSLANPGMGWAIDQAHALGVGVLVKKALASGRVGAGHGISAADALRFALDRPGVSGVVVGTVSPGHLRANARAADGADPLGGDAPSH
jgi:aryl-alcohol dehydrogenase-like predicted oxidoreductase